MKNKVLIYARLGIAIIVLVLCVCAFFEKFYPVKIFDMQFTAALQSGMISGFGIGAIFFTVLIVLTLLFGRVYCSVLCPLGIYQELIMVLFKPFYKRRKFQPAKHYIFAYFLAAILFGLLFGGTVVALKMIDPYSIAGNAMSGAVFGLGFAVALAVLVFFKKRFFCTNICPVGAVLGLISRFSLFKIRIDDKKCKVCSLCALKCPCGSIDFKNFNVNNETCIKCFKCLSYCNHNALYYGLPKAERIKFNPKRRQFLVSGLVLATFGVAFKGGIELSKKIATKVKNAILPAGSDNVQDFANRCLNCNLCVQNCPMKIIKPATNDVPFIHLDYGNKYCDFNCNRCSSVCPSGAIKRISLKEKQNIKIANAVVNEDICIKCGTCASECPKQIIIKDSEADFPIVQFDKCLGCGKCASACPVGAITIEPVNRQVNLN